MKTKHIVLIGPRSCGKTTVGQALAEQIGRPFFDVDASIGETTDFTAIYRSQGEQIFRALETEAIKAIVEHPEPAVIATGGGILLRIENFQHLTHNTIVFYLQATIKTLKARWKKNPPSFIDVDNLSNELKNYHQQRTTAYENLADLTVSVDGKTINTIVTNIYNLFLNSRLVDTEHREA